MMAENDEQEQSDEQESISQDIEKPTKPNVSRSERAPIPDTTFTLDPLKEASPQDWLGSNQDPDVLLSIPNLGVDRIALNVENVRAHVELHAKVLDLLELHVGADVSIDKVELEIDNVRVQAMLKVKLEKVVDLVDKVITLIDHHPEILSNLTSGLGAGVQSALSGGRLDDKVGTSEGIGDKQFMGDKNDKSDNSNGEDDEGVA